tara:strand:- start:234 stop:737 length:504 start_codon:yes stop_codon:yes gene_type:complete
MKNKKRVVVEISNDIMGCDSWDMYKEDIKCLAEDLDISVNNGNIKMENILKQKENIGGNYSNHIIVDCIGYSQGDWDSYAISYNIENQKEVDEIVKELKKLFTHKNDYCVNKYDVITIDGEEFKGEVYDYTWFSIMHIEFPSEKEVINYYSENYGKDYNEIIINING